MVISYKKFTIYGWFKPFILWIKSYLLNFMRITKYNFRIEIDSFSCKRSLIYVGADFFVITQQTFTCSKSTTEILCKGVKYVESYNKDTRTIPLKFFSVSSVDFKKVFVFWELETNIVLRTQYA